MNTQQQSTQHISDLEQKLSGISGTPESNYGKLLSEIFLDAITLGNFQFLGGLRNLVIQIYANFSAVFLRKDLGEKYHNPLAGFIGYLILKLTAIIAGFTGVFGGYSVAYSHINLFAKFYLYFIILHSVKIWYRRTYQPHKQIYSESRGSSLLYPYFLKLLAHKKWGSLSECGFQKWVEPALLIAAAIFLKVTGLAPSFGSLVLFIGLAVHFEAALLEKNMRSQFLSMVDAKLVNSAIMEAIKDDHPMTSTRHGVPVSHVVVNSLKHEIDQARSQENTPLSELQRHQTLE